MEERVRIQPLQDMLSLTQQLEPANAKVERAPEPREVKAQNEQSMAALQAMLAPVPNAPTKKKPRRTRK